MIKCSCNQKCGGKIEITDNYTDDMIYVSMTNAVGGFASVYLNATAIEKLISELQSGLEIIERTK